MLLHEVQDSADNRFLFFVAVAQTVTVDMNMKSAGACLVRTVAEADRLVHDFIPAKILVIVQCHGMGDDFHSVVKRTVGLNVDMVVSGIADFQQLVGIIAVLAALVDFQFNAEITAVVAVENRSGLIPIFIDTVG